MKKGIIVICTSKLIKPHLKPVFRLHNIDLVILPTNTNSNSHLDKTPIPLNLLRSGVVIFFEVISTS